MINCNNCAICDFKESLCHRCDEMKRLGSAEDIEKALIGIDNDCISRQAAIDCMIRLQREDEEAYGAFIPEGFDGDRAAEALMQLPSAPPECKVGEWEEIEVIPEAYDIAGVKTWASKMRCNQCGFITFAIEGKFAQYDFCPNCGADMRGDNHAID